MCIRVSSAEPSGGRWGLHGRSFKTKKIRILIFWHNLSSQVNRISDLERWRNNGWRRDMLILIGITAALSFLPEGGSVAAIRGPYTAEGDKFLATALTTGIGLSNPKGDEVSDD
jgi:hypothetical protein